MPSAPDRGQNQAGVGGGLRIAMELLPDDWPGVFSLETPLVELLVRGTVLYAAIVLLMRVMPRRTGGELALTDLVFVVLIGHAASKALGDYTAVADGVVIVTTLMFWNYVLNFLSYRSRFFERFLAPSPLQIVRNGELLRRNMRREFLTEDELVESLRKQGYEDLSEVKAAYVETEGKITVIGRDHDSRR